MLYSGHVHAWLDDSRDRICLVFFKFTKVNTLRSRKRFYFVMLMWRDGHSVKNIPVMGVNSVL